MSIIFNKKEKIFNLKTNNTLYQMMIAKSNVLMHTYYGEAFNEGNAGMIWRRVSPPSRWILKYTV